MEIVTFRHALQDDVEQIIELVGAAIEKMKASGIDQWDEIYPAAEDFLNDMASGGMYLGFIGEQLASMYTINNQFDDDYFADGIPWDYPVDGACCIHRLCVHPFYQGKGIGGITLRHAQSMIEKMGYESIRLDVFSENPGAIRLYEREGYIRKGSAFWRKGEFFLMEKKLEGNF